MDAIPPLIRDFIQNLSARVRAPAWVRVDRDLNVSDSGGALADYGLGCLRKGEPLLPVAEFLEGLLPLEGVPVTLPCIATSTMKGMADIHLIPASEGDWVLLLDATEEAERRQIIQQQLSDLTLLQQREAKALTRLSAEQEKSERLLLSLFPKAIADRLKGDTTTSVAQEYDAVTILFADIHDFWKVAGPLSPGQLIELLNEVFSLFDRLADAHGVQKIKTIGDSYMAVAGLPEPRADHAQAIADMALSMQREIAGVRAPSGSPFSVRIGVHSGPAVAGIVGIRRQAYDLWGPTVNLANQMESCGLPGGIQITSATYELLGAKYLVEPRGEFYVKGQGSVETFLLKGRARN